MWIQISTKGLKNLQHKNILINSSSFHKTYDDDANLIRIYLGLTLY